MYVCTPSPSLSFAGKVLYAVFSPALKSRASVRAGGGRGGQARGIRPLAQPLAREERRPQDRRVGAAEAEHRLEFVRGTSAVKRQGIRGWFIVCAGGRGGAVSTSFQTGEKGGTELTRKSCGTHRFYSLASGLNGSRSKGMPNGTKPTRHLRASRLIASVPLLRPGVSATSTAS